MGRPRSSLLAVLAVTATASMPNLLAKFGDPLIDQVGRTHDGEAVDLAAIDHLAGDEAGFDGLADADVIRDEETYRVELERHQ